MSAPRRQPGGRLRPAFAAAPGPAPVAGASGVGNVPDRIVEARRAAGAAVGGSPLGLPAERGLRDVGGGRGVARHARRHLEPVRGRGGDRAGGAGDDELALGAVGSRDLDPAFLDGHGRAGAIDRDGEDRPLDEGDEIRRANAEMRRVLLLDPEDGASVILQHLDDAARIARLREPQARRRRDDDVILAAHQHRPGAGGGLDHVARPQQCAATQGGDGVAVADVDLAGRFGDAPGGLRGGRRRAGREEEQGDERGAHGHGTADSSACAWSGARPIMPDAALTKAQWAWLRPR